MTRVLFADLPQPQLMVIAEPSVAVFLRTQGLAEGCEVVHPSFRAEYAAWMAAHNEPWVEVSRSETGL